MKENLEPTIRFILAAEGGYTVDTGGATQMGLTIGLMKALKLDLNHDGMVDDKDVKLVDAALVHKVFLEQFWNPIGGDDLPSGIDLVAADFAYNAGPTAAKTLLMYPTVESYTVQRMMFYKRLVIRNPAKYRDFEKGWYRRALDACQAAINLKG
jgi:lysozyme family protein